MRLNFVEQSFSMSILSPCMYFVWSLLLLSWNGLSFCKRRRATSLIFMLQFMIVDNNFPMWLLISWKLGHQPVKISVRRSSFTNKDINTLRPKQNGRHFADDIFKCIFLNENVWIPIKFSMKFVLKGPINNIPSLVQIMAWRRPGDKPLSEPMMVSLTTHICVTRTQWVNMESSE